LYIINYILDYDFFQIDESWGQFLTLFGDIQCLEIKEERVFDPRRSLRLERELMNLLGESIIKELSSYFQKKKKSLLKDILNIQDNQGDTVLHVAAFHGDYRIVQKLINCKADKTIRNDDNKIPVDLAKDNFVRKVLTNLNKAAKAADEKNMTELIHFGHDINERLSIFNQAPIHKVIESKEKDKYDVLKKMLDMGADPNLKDSNSWTALHYSCEFGDFDAVKILLSKGANVDAYSNNHRTGLHLSSSMNFPKIVTYLLENGANPNFEDNQKCTPLHLAAKHGNIDCMAILLSYKATLYAEDFRRWNILHYAAFQGHSKAVRYISKYDSDRNHLQTTRNSQSKLAIEIVRDHRVKPYFITLWHASKEGDLDMVRWLQNEGEDLDEQSTFMKNTPLHIAVFNNHYLLVRLLLELGASSDYE
jgi:ankyrin repeat protein